jgi:NADPH:quinone reductase-like Zn-dependent oxidoreductase
MEVSALLDAGKLRAFVDAEIAFSDAASAYARKSKRDRGYGKTVIVVSVHEGQQQGEA